MANGILKCCSVPAVNNGSMKSVLAVCHTLFTVGTGTYIQFYFLITLCLLDSIRFSSFVMCLLYRFYVFVCSMCNYGKEFVRRLELKWVDLVHLMLYNLTVYNAKKYYDLDTVIVPYAIDNWNTLQLPPRVSK